MTLLRLKGGGRIEKIKPGNLGNGEEKLQMGGLSVLTLHTDTAALAPGCSAIFFFSKR